MLAGVTIHTFLLTGLMATVFIVLFKYVAARPQMPQGLRSLAGAI